MEKKSAIISSVTREIEGLSVYYETKLKKKEQEIETLTAITHDMQRRIIQLELANRKLKKTTKKNTETTIKKTIESTVVSEANLLVEAIINAIDKKQIAEIEITLRNAINKSHIFTVADKELEGLLKSLINRLFLNESKFSNTDYDQTFMLAFQLMQSLESSALKNVIKQSLQVSFHHMLENILHTNYLAIIISYLKTCKMYRVYAQFKNSLTRIFELEWEFLEGHISEEELNTILGYAYLTETDNLLWNIMSEEKLHELKENTVYYIFFYLLDLEKSVRKSSLDYYKECKRLFRNGTGLTNKEKEEVIKIVSNRLNNLRRKITTATTPKKSKMISKGDKNGIDLKEESDLKAFGYQITGLNREARWIVLKKAVPALGLYKVAYTIANHVKMRKGQKNGHITFKHSITQWEYDLNRLKKAYFKNDFRWPSTELK